MVQADHSLWDVLGHRYIDMPFFILPTNVYTEVVLACPVHSNVALVAKCREEMICVLLREKLDSKIIHTKTELGLESSVRPKTVVNGMG